MRLAFGFFILLGGLSTAFAQGANGVPTSTIGAPPASPNPPTPTPGSSSPSPEAAGAPDSMASPGAPGLNGSQNGPGASLPTSFIPPGSPQKPVDDMPSMKSVDGLSSRDPFRLPEELLIKLRRKSAVTDSAGIDMSIPTIRRYPLASYQLVGIIWDVNKPKAMFMDREKKVHMLRENDFIGNAKGVITSIQGGSVTVLEGKIPQIIKLNK